MDDNNSSNAQALLRQVQMRGQMMFRTGAELLALRDAARAWRDGLGVEVVFDPETPAELRDYLLAGSIGAVEGVCVGGLFGLFIGALVNAPGTGLLVGAGLGGATGAAAGAAAVNRGIRVRINAWWAATGAVAVAELA